MIRVLLADDEPVALERLELAVACIPDAQLVGKARNGKEALALIRELKPDVAVLDIQMPVKTGLAAVEELRPGEHVPEIVFVTAFSEHAIRAFEVRAVDYLLKPVSFERFREAITRARARLDARAAEVRFAELQELIVALRTSGGSNGAIPYERELWTRTRDGITRIPLDSVDWIGAEGDYVLLHIGERTLLHKDTISSLNTRLDPAQFLRVHRSAIVNLDRIRSIRRHGARAMALVLGDDTEVAIGPSHVEAVLKAVNAKRWR